MTWSGLTLWKWSGGGENQESSQVWSAVWKSATDEEGKMQVPNRDRRKGMWKERIGKWTNGAWDKSARDGTFLILFGQSIGGKLILHFWPFYQLKGLHSLHRQNSDKISLAPAPTSFLEFSPRPPDPVSCLCNTFSSFLVEEPWFCWVHYNIFISLDFLAATGSHLIWFWLLRSKWQSPAGTSSGESSWRGQIQLSSIFLALSFVRSFSFLQRRMIWEQPSRVLEDKNTN